MRGEKIIPMIKRIAMAVCLKMHGGQLARVVGMGTRDRSPSEKRMADRDFTEVDLRDMLEHATVFLPAVVEGRWIIKTKHRRRPWKVIVEPDFDRQLLVIVTAYPVTRA